MDGEGEFLDEDLAPYLLHRKPDRGTVLGVEAATPQAAAAQGARRSSAKTGRQSRKAARNGSLSATQRSPSSEPSADLEPPQERATSPVAAPRAPAAHSIDALFVSDTGRAFIVGWSDDAEDPLHGIGISLGTGKLAVLAGQLARCRRRDVEAALGVEARKSFGFFGFLLGNVAFSPRSDATCFLQFSSGVAAQHQIRAKILTDEALLEVALGYLAGMDVHGNRVVETFRTLESGLGSALIRHWRELSGRISAGALCDRFGPMNRKIRASVVVCLYGRAEYFFLQSALFGAAQELADCEFIYVSNSPELAESLGKEARIAQRLYGLSQALVTLPGNAGFGRANNAAARFANSDRLLFVNPDVVPMATDWAARHRRILESAPHHMTRIMGAPLFYADGSLMHAGLHFEMDWGLSVIGNEVRKLPMLRVEHYGKGAPADLTQFADPRQVPATSGAFISIDRRLFEGLGGFSEDYVFGHYEDADLCLRAYASGTGTWIHDIPLWHLEGKGSIRLPFHEGASLINRWQCTRAWHEVLMAEGLVGRSPALKPCTLTGNDASCPKNASRRRLQRRTPAVVGAPRA